jgi:hypothetical protein
VIAEFLLKAEFLRGTASYVSRGLAIQIGVARRLRAMQHGNVVRKPYKNGHASSLAGAAVQPPDAMRRAAMTSRPSANN